MRVSRESTSGINRSERCFFSNWVVTLLDTMKNIETFLLAFAPQGFYHVARGFYSASFPL
jgi:hypothetical protein